MTEKGTRLSSCVGADVHPGLSSIEPEDSCGPLGVVGHDEWHRSIKGHRGVQVILVNIHVVEPVWVSITEGKRTLWINAGLLLLTFFFLAATISQI